MKLTREQRLAKLAVLHGGEWYVQRMEQLLGEDMNNPTVQNELKHVSLILINNYHELKEECDLKRSRPIGFRMSQRLNKLNELFKNGKS